LNVILAYTMSRLMDNHMTSLVNERHYRAVSQYDQKHVMRMAFVYQLPGRFSGPGWNRLLDGALGGWRLSGHVKYTTGQPLTVTHANGRPIRIRSPKLSGKTGDRLGDRRDAAGNVINPFFDINAFQPLPTQYMVTPEPPYLDDLRAPTLFFTNFQLFKAFRVVERLKLEFSFQADNAFNSPQWAAPGTNMSNRATFGVINNADDARTVMTSLRLRF
jgi:hypothetical protein